MDIRTEYQKRVARRHAAIISMYRKLQREKPDISIHRACTIIGAAHDMTPQGVRKVINESSNNNNNEK